MKIGIVGNESAKFTTATEDQARLLILELLSVPGAELVSGHCHLGGIDIWAEECADALGLPKLIFPPAVRSWNEGYKPRNIQIAQECDELHNILVRSYPKEYTGLRFNKCYHCLKSDHVKSGGCWTALCARRLGKPAFWHILDTD